MWLRKLIFSVLLVTASSFALNMKDVGVSIFANEIDHWVKSGEETDLFKAAVNFLRIPTELRQTDWRSFTGKSNLAICTICRSTMKVFIGLRRKGMTEEQINKKLTKFCVLLNIQTERVCKGVIELNTPILAHIVDSKPNLTSETVCGIILESRSCSITDPEHEWNITIDSNPGLEIPKNDNRESIEILHITDLHYDPLYEPSGNSDCGEPACCRKGQNATNVNAIAGYWGDYGNCDTPWHAVVDALDWMKDTHRDVSYVYYTGDIIDHGVWETSMEGNIESLNKSFAKIYETFRDIPVYPILGNHEPHPLNLFAPKSITQDHMSTQWLYKLMADLWIGYGWLPESTRSTILQGGFYTVSPRKGFRVIALNSNVCYCYNWWLLYSPRDPDNQLQWLADTLLKAERNEEYVHILSHIPGNHKDCVRTWRREYLRIVSRFSHIIVAQFNGHTHNDELAVYYDNDVVPNNVAWNGGSLTAFVKLNPNYKVYAVDGSNFAVQDYENWMYDLDSANKNPKVRPVWYKSYSFKSEYGLSDLSAKSLSNWIFSTANNETVLNQYYRHFYKHAAPSLKDRCNLRCKKQLLCRTIASSKKEELCKNIL